MARLAILFALLMVFWLLLSGQSKPWLLIVGFLSVSLCTWVAWRMRTPDDEGLPVELTMSAVTYWPWLAVEIAKSALSVTRIILHPRLPISPTMTRVKASQRSAPGLTTFANSITLTPGTIAVEVAGDEGEILVHALAEDVAQDLEEGSFDRRVSEFEGSR